MAVLQQFQLQKVSSKQISLFHLFAKDGQSRREQVYYLKTVTFSYLLLPNLIFLIGWLQWYWSLPSVALLLWATFNFTFQQDRKVDGFTLSFKDLFVIGLIALFITWFAGVGGFTSQLIDYEKHNAVFHDLMVNNWPVIYTDHQYIQAPVFLDYYLAWYLPPTLLAKLTIPALVGIYAYIWTALGLFLALCWFTFLCKSVKWWIFVLFFFLADLESAYTLFRFFIKSVFIGVWNLEMLWAELKFTDIIFNNFTPNYASYLTQFEWAPQHTIVAMLGASMFLYFFLHEQNSKHLLLVGSLLLLWSPFVAVGLLPLIGLVMYNNPKKLFSFENMLAGGSLFLIIAAYYHAHFPQQFRWIWQVYDHSVGLYKIPLFITVKFGMLMLLVYPLIKHRAKYKQLFLLLVVVLTFCPFVYIGYQADFTMRASAPWWFVLVFLTVKAFQEKITKSYIRYTFVVLVALSLSRYVFYGKHMHKKIPNKSVVASKPLTQLYKQKWFNKQYFGSMDSFFIKYLAKRNE